MILEKFILSVYMKNYRQVMHARKHFLGSIKELLMAASFSFDIVGRVADQTPIVKSLPPVRKTLKNLQNIVQFSVKKMAALEPSTQADITGIKTRVIESIMGVIEEEMDAIPRGGSAKNQMKIEALQSVRQALLNHLGAAPLKRWTAAEMPAAANE